MSIDVCIKQKGLFKKTIPLDVIIGDEFAFGINDGMRMVGDDQEGNMIFYNPNSIGRGFHISWDEDEKNELIAKLRCRNIDININDYQIYDILSNIDGVIYQ